MHSGKIRTPKRKKFVNVLVIGGSALGPQFVAEALGSTDDKMRPFFFDNTDPREWAACSRASAPSSTRRSRASER